MKILYLHQHFRTPDQPGGTRSFEFAKRWVATGHEVHVVTTQQGRDSSFKGWRVRIIEGVHVHELSINYDNTMGFIERLRAFAEFALRAIPRCVAIGGDIVFASSTPLTVAIPGIRASSRLQVPMVFEVRDLWPEVPIAMGILRNPGLIWASRTLERLAYLRASHIIALSPGMAAGIERVCQQPEKISIIPNACDTTLLSTGNGQRFLSDYPELRGRSIVLYGGTLGEVNGIGYVLDIANVMPPDNNIAFVIVGDGKQKQLLIKRAKDEGLLGKNVFFLPPIPKDQMADVLQACSVATSFVLDLPALWDNSANKFFDALAAGKPIVINHEGWLADLIRAHGVGLILPAATPDLAARLLQSYLNDKRTMLQAGVRARRLAVQEFDRDKLAAHALRVLINSSEQQAV